MLARTGSADLRAQEVLGGRLRPGYLPPSMAPTVAAPHAENV